MPQFDAVLFDLDGTLLYTLPDIAESLNRALESRGYPAHGLEAVRGFVGNGAARLVARALPGGADNPDYAAVRQAYDRIYAAHACDRTRPYPGVQELLAALKRRGIRTGVVTNKADSDARPMIRRYFPGMVDAVRGKREGCPTKPAPEAALAVLAELGCRRDRALLVGDSSVDRETARNAGLACVLVAWGYEDLTDPAPTPVLGILRRPEELLSYVDEP